MTFKAEITECVMWELRMSETDRDTLVEWLRYAINHCETLSFDLESEDITKLIMELGVY